MYGPIHTKNKQNSIRAKQKPLLNLLICLGDGGRLATRGDVVVDKPLELLFNGNEGVGMNLEGVLRIALVDIGNITSLMTRANVKCDSKKTHQI